MHAARLGWRPRRVEFLRWRTVTRRTSWTAMRKDHGVHLPGRVQVLARKRGTAWLLSMPAERFDAAWRESTGNGWRCTVVRVPVVR